MQTNKQQQQAVEAGNGPVAIIAGPGTGKTKTLVARITFLIDAGVPPASILALTFTKKAAGEMASRVGGTTGSISRQGRVMFSLLGLERSVYASESKSAVAPSVAGASSGLPRISTFHALCFELVREKLGEPPAFISEPARLALIKKLPKAVALKGVSIRELSLLISRAKNMATDNTDIARLVGTYNAALRQQNLHDFDDLLLQTRNLLRDDPAWRVHIQNRFTHILVDEFQDTNALQYEILQLLRANQNLFVIGDPLQSIYGFRGADGDIFARFLHDFASAITIVLTTNYRSAGSIVNLANAIFTDAPQLHAHSKNAGMAQVVEVLNEYREADWVLDTIQTAIGGSDLQRAVSDDARAEHRTLRDFAVLYRSRHAARALQKAFETSGLPFQIVGEGSPYDQPAVQAVIQILAQLADPGRKAVAKGFSEQQISVLLQKLDAQQTPHKLAEDIVAAFALPVDATMRQLFSVLVRFKTAQEAVNYFDGIATQDFYDPQADAITLLTVHAAKGLEFAHVFLIAAEEGILPSTRGDAAEEKRLFYVAATRAKEQLDILYADKRGGEHTQLSRFVAAIDPKILPRNKDANFVKDQRLAQKRQAKRAQTSLF